MDNSQITIGGTEGKTYDLDELQRQGRTDPTAALTVQVYEYKDGQSPNPPDLKLGQIWISKLTGSDPSLGIVEPLIFECINFPDSIPAVEGYQLLYRIIPSNVINYKVTMESSDLNLQLDYNNLLRYTGPVSIDGKQVTAKFSLTKNLSFTKTFMVYPEVPKPITLRGISVVNPITTIIEGTNYSFNFNAVPSNTSGATTYRIFSSNETMALPLGDKTSEVQFANPSPTDATVDLTFEATNNGVVATSMVSITVTKKVSRMSARMQATDIPTTAPTQKAVTSFFSPDAITGPASGILVKYVIVPAEAQPTPVTIQCNNDNVVYDSKTNVISYRGVINDPSFTITVVFFMGTIYTVHDVTFIPDIVKTPDEPIIDTFVSSEPPVVLDTQAVNEPAPELQSQVQEPAPGPIQEPIPEPQIPAMPEPEIIPIARKTVTESPAPEIGFFDEPADAIVTAPPVAPVQQEPVAPKEAPKQTSRDFFE